VRDRGEAGERLAIQPLASQFVRSRSRPVTCSAPAGMRSPTHLRCVSSLLKRFGAPQRGTSRTGFCACLRAGCSPFPESHERDDANREHTQVDNLCYGEGCEGLPVPGSRRCFRRAATMAKRRKHRASEGLEGQSERPATGTGSPERAANVEDTQVENLCYGEGCEGLPVPERRRCFRRAATMAKRRKHRASEGLEGRSERPATGMGSPEPTANVEDTQVGNLCYERTRAHGESGRHTG